MTVFFIIVGSLFAANFIWWLWADAKLRKFGAKTRPWRVAIALWSLVMAGLFTLEFFDREQLLPGWLLVAVYIWHLIVLPAVLLAFFAALSLSTAKLVRRLASPTSPKKNTEVQGHASGAAPSELSQAAASPAGTAGDAVRSDSSSIAPPPAMSRRQLLTTALVAAGPPLMQFSGVTSAILDLGRFRVRKIDVAYANLPRGLDGVSIAHITDTHFGPFTTRADMRSIVEASNSLEPDVVVFTGDLIDGSLEQLPIGVDMLRGLKARSGIVAIEGNHDLFENRRAFELGIRNEGFPLLLNEGYELRVGRMGYPVRFLGLQWGKPGLRRGANLEGCAQLTLAHKNPDAFNVMLTHHPHGFDYAAQADVPLTLAGHTHGGQLMASEGLGAGPLMYKYWSGLYRHTEKPDAACVVSNGIGNWFPLRVNAPAELVMVTLRRA